MDELPQWLEAHGLGKYLELFRSNEVTFADLRILTDHDVRELGLPMGPRRRLLTALAALRSTSVEAASPQPYSPESSAGPERRQLSVMFCDLVGSTSLSEAMDPEDFRDVIARFQGTATAAIRDFGGYVARYMGDGLLAYFGYPQAHEDDAERAVRAGLGIVDALSRMDGEGVGKLQVRVGISTGLVIAGDIVGEGASEERAVLGDTPNLAARLQGIASPDSVVVSDSTRSLVEGLFTLEALGARAVKGLSSPVDVYRVTGETDTTSRFEAAAARGLSPLVGRGEEIGLLRNRWEQACDGEGQVVLLSGEAGVGKSRILRAFRDVSGVGASSLVQFLCSPHHQRSFLHPVIGHLGRALGLERCTSSADKLGNLEAALDELGLPQESHGPVLASLLSIPMPGRHRGPEMGPLELRRETFATLRALLGAMARQGPLLVVVEDAHWIDPSTEELIGSWIDDLRPLPVLLAVTHRPEYVSAWGERTYATALALNRLGRRECAELVAKLTNGKELPSRVSDQILGRTDGVPLFVEELTRTVLDSGLLVDRGDRFELAGQLPSLGIPSSLQDSLMARLDRLTASKDTAQLASAIGRSFDLDLLAAVSSRRPVEVRAALTELLDAGLVYRRDSGSPGSYEFKHALVQEIAYQSLLRRTRRQFHRRIASALERLDPGRMEREPEVLAHHYTEAGLAEKAVEYWQMAGTRALRRSANLEAEGHIKRGLELIAGLPDSLKRRRRYAALQNTLGVCLMPTRGFGNSEVADAFSQAAGACEALNDTRGLYVALRGLGQYQMISGNLRKAAAQTERITSLAEELKDEGALLEAHHLGWITLTFTGDFAAARAHADAGIAMYERERDHPLTHVYSGHDPGVCCHCFGALPTWQLGYPDRALAICEQGSALARDLGHPFSHAVSLWATGMLRQLRRETAATLETAESTIALSSEGGFALLLRLAHEMRGWALACAGELEEGIGEVRQAIDDLRRDGTEFALPGIYAHLGELCAWSGAVQEGLAAVEDGLAIADRIGGYFSLPELYRVEGELRLSESAKNLDRAARCFERSVQVAARQGAKLLELRASASLARLRGTDGRREEAAALLSRSYGWFTEGFDTPDLLEAKALLQELR